MNIRKWMTVAVLATAVSHTAFSGPDSSGPDSSANSEWITLGTMAGPQPDPMHSQPANALVVNDRVYLVDAGDGAVGRLATAGQDMQRIEAVFISHLHFDHIGGLPALISLRWQTGASHRLTVYGPPGTRQMVEGIFAFMAYGVEGHYGVPGKIPPPANHNVNVVELGDGEVVEFEDFILTAARNTHYSWPKGSEEWEKFLSFAYRFELPDRTIVYTGDTGPSKAVEELARGADLLVSEMMDIDHIIALLKRVNPGMEGEVFDGITTHLASHHLSPEQVGQMADRAGVKRVVVTHMAPGLTEPKEMEYYSQRVKARYKGPVTIARDLDRF